jgi:hypothetical protein
MSNHTPMLLFGTMIALFLIAGGIWYQSLTTTPVGLDAIQEAQDLVDQKEASFENVIKGAENAVQNAVQKSQGIGSESIQETVQENVLQGGGLSCTDSDTDRNPNPIYFKGVVTIVYDGGGEVSVADECAESFLKVKEYWCSENSVGSGSYALGKTEYDCPKGCFDGACVR